jgi:selenocysteine lyase/cysteine desulfurase
LDNGATTQKPQSVIDATVEYYENIVQILIEVVLEMQIMPQEFENTREVLKDL